MSQPIISKPSTKEYRESFDKIFGTKQEEEPKKVKTPEDTLREIQDIIITESDPYIGLKKIFAITSEILRRK